MEVRRRPWAMGFAACSSAALLSSPLLGCGGTEPTTSNSTPITTAQAAVDSDNAKNDVVLEDLESATPAFGAAAASADQVSATALAVEAAAAVAPLVNGGIDAHTKGAFEAVHQWPIMPIAVMTLSDGRVFAYGTDKLGAQGAKLFYTIWNPKLGTGPAAFNTLPNTTNTDIFCAGQAFFPDGRALLVGGDRTTGGGRNYAINDATVFNPANNSLKPDVKDMNFRRWYATAVMMPNGTHVVLGGRDDKKFDGNGVTPPNPETYSPTPEIRLGNGTWQPLTGASSQEAFGNGKTHPWFYPRSWLNSQGNIFIVGHDGLTFTLDPDGKAGTGLLTKHSLIVKGGKTNYSAVMVKQDEILSVRNGKQAILINIKNPTAPTAANAGVMAYERQQGSMTVLADGTVLASGGSSLNNDVSADSIVAYETELWNPLTKIWTKGAKATKPRLYHSTSLLLADGRVFTGGGGAPKAIAGENQLNGEIYYPPYLFDSDGSGDLAARPEITAAPTTAVTWNQVVTITADEKIKRLTLLRAGAATHTFDNEARFFDFPITTPNFSVTMKVPATANIAPPGYYMVFAWNEEGVPSEAKMIRIAVK